MAERLFVALGLDAPTRAALDAALEPIRASAPSGVRWVPPDNWHITLQFLGSVDEARTPSIAAACAEGLHASEAFEWSTGRLGAFPEPRRARVLWLGVDQGGPAICDLARAVTGATAALGFSAEHRTFTPHITLGRRRRPASLPSFDQPLEPVLLARAGSVLLMRSELSSAGARYEVVEEFVLRSADPAR